MNRHTLLANQKIRFGHTLTQLRLKHWSVCSLKVALSVEKYLTMKSLLQMEEMCFNKRAN